MTVAHVGISIIVNFKQEKTTIYHKQLTVLSLEVCDLRVKFVQNVRGVTNCVYCTKITNFGNIRERLQMV